VALITIASTEHNVTKSYTAAHIAHGAAITGLKTLIIDLSPDAGVSTLLGCTLNKSNPSSADLIRAHGKLENVPAEIIVENIRPDLDIIPSNGDLLREVKNLKVRDPEFMLLSDFQGLKETIPG
jgi:chromosome partitioning protein